ncbi:hypothetical protein AXG93_2446s1060 [Marchantia polymorpha subsp. ruderalis]|uniref:Uncharacterized protein n=1 Tax=Marchantia polymorpha subsp. ruderalis TaxID=1480154 RepID=A0A176W6Z7_MARPO|nr:hypothetical protein AXG93_2446s1060 [Marchantia polymorpha subsp. ruderalis]
MQWELMTFSMSLEIRVEIPVLESNSTEPREVKSQYSDRQQQEDSQVRQKDKARGSCRRGGEGEGGGRLSLSDAPHFKPSMTKHEAAAAAAGQRRSDLIFEAPNKHAFSVPGALNTEEPGPHTLLPSLPFGFSSPQAMQRLLLLQQGPTYRATLPSLFLSLFL